MAAGLGDDAVALEVKKWTILGKITNKCKSPRQITGQ
jgi:hypothetical protein